MVDLIDEIKEDLKQEKLVNLWNKYGNQLIGVAVAIVIVTAGVTAWKSYQISKNERIGSKFYNAYELEHKADFDTSLKAYEDIENHDKGAYAALADIRSAGILFDKGEKAKAIEIYKQVSQNSKAPKEIRDLAEIYLIYNSADFSNINPDLMARVQKIADDKKAVFASSAKEILAYMQYAKNDYDAAEKIFDEIAKGLETPASMRIRAEEMLNIVKTRKGK